MAICSKSHFFISISFCTAWFDHLEILELDSLPLAMMYCVSIASETRAIITSASDSTISWQALRPA